MTDLLKTLKGCKMLVRAGKLETKKLFASSKPIRL